MTTVTTEQVQKDVPELLARLRRGEILSIEQEGQAVATLSLANEQAELPRPVRLGSLAGKISIPDNWKEIARDEIEREFYGIE